MNGRERYHCQQIEKLSGLVASSDSCLFQAVWKGKYKGKLSLCLDNLETLKLSKSFPCWLIHSEALSFAFSHFERESVFVCEAFHVFISVTMT